MKINRIPCLLITLLCVTPAMSMAQEVAARHPLLEDSWIVSVGAFFPSQDFQLSADGSLPGEEIDFDERVGISDSSTTPILSARWRFGKKWSVWGQAWQTDNSGHALLNSDVEWQDLVFRAGTNVAGGIESSVVRLFFGRTFSTGERHEFGAGIGLHRLKVDAYLQGDILTSEGDLKFTRSSVDASLPLPNIGAWYHLALNERWFLQARVDWLSASVGDYSGSLWNSSIGTQWQLTRHIGLGINYQVFHLNGDIRKDDWHGSAKLENQGATLFITTNW